ncbi:MULTISPECIES: hypothetical protein [unclassified Bradyrhizobium]|uniref:hypothetical protein n=1 Tax=unclassified Bradyrhizobium TaxID=2631580 RepID=UPI001FFA102F|nr:MULTISPECIES: hypothetical protein [unclassified Bradyrhizobium]
MVGGKQGIDRFDQFGGITLKPVSFCERKRPLMKSFNFVPFGLSMPQRVGRDVCFRTKCEHGSLKARNYDGIGRVIALFVRCSPGTLVESLAGQPGAFYGRAPDVASAGRGRSRLVNLGKADIRSARH